MTFTDYTGTSCKCGEPSVKRVSPNSDENRPTSYDLHFCEKCYEKWRREIAWETQFECREDKITCPYCGNHKDYSWEYEHDDPKMECLDCGKFFMMEVERSVTYKTYRCVEDMPEDWEEDDE